MPNTSTSAAEAKRLEDLWHGDFGTAYVGRNKDAGSKRGRFWNEFLSEFPVSNVLEIGCNVGINLAWFAKKIPEQQIYGLDINEAALKILHERLPGVNGVFGQAKDLPFKDAYFDLTFTAGVLIHQPEESLVEVMSEIVRCSKKYVLCSEYFSEQTVEVPYRDQSGALFKRDYGALYLKHFPQLKLVKQGFLTKAEEWDDETFWIFEKKS